MTIINSAQQTSMDKFIGYYTNTAIFLFFTLALIVPSGYSYGAAMLLLISLPFMFKKSTYQNISKESKIIIFSLLFFAAVWIFEILYHNSTLKGFDKASRYIIGVVVLLFLLKHPPKQKIVWFSFAAGGVATGIFAIWYKLTTGVARVDGYTNSIHYGNISMLMGVLSLSGLTWAWQQQKYKYASVIILLTGFFLGLLASLLSGTRGGWIGIPLTLIYIVIHYRKQLSWLKVLALFTLILATLTISYNTPATGVKHRVNLAFHELKIYQEGSTKTSVGTRLELWRGSLILFKEKPILGWGELGYDERITELVRQEKINPSHVSHSHNEILYIIALRGCLGLFSILLLYLAPLFVFRKLNKDKLLQKTSLPLAGILFIFCYIDFGLTQAFMIRNAGVLFFIMPLIIIYSTVNKRFP